MATPVIIDANSLANRCIRASALDDLKFTNKPTGGVYGFINTLASLFCTPTFLNIAGIYAFFDDGIPDERMRLIPEFKTNRADKNKMFTPEQEEVVFQQIEFLENMLPSMGVVVGKWPKTEADDAVARAVRILVAQGHTPIVVSGDKDLWQTVKMGATVWYLGDKTLITPDNFTEQAGVYLKYYVLYRGLSGDASDGIKGVNGCGEKRAKELIQAAGVLPDTPCEQYKAIVTLLKQIEFNNAKLATWEKNVITSEARLLKVLKGIDLSNNYGVPTAAMEETLKLRPQFEKGVFVKHCMELGLSRFIAGVYSHHMPFIQAAKRRDAIK